MAKLSQPGWLWRPNSAAIDELELQRLSRLLNAAGLPVTAPQIDAATLDASDGHGQEGGAKTAAFRPATVIGRRLCHGIL